MGSEQAEAQPSLELKVGTQAWVVEPGSVTIGRGADARVQVDDILVSRLHAVAESTADGWQLLDISRNGIFQDGRRVKQIGIDGPTTVRLGDPATGAELMLAPVDAAGVRLPAMSSYGKVTAVHHPSSSLVRIGRNPDNDVVLDDLLVSRRHAELVQTDRLWEIRDLGSPNGTFVNGRRVQHAPLSPHDVVGIGHSLLQFTGDELVVRADTGEVSFEACELGVTTPEGKSLLDSVGFALEGCSLLAVVGPSGAGKSTLLGALTGFRPATIGSVRYGGRDLYVNYEELRQRIGLVPQDDILHSQLTVRRALSFAAQLRFPAETSEAEREQRIDAVLKELGLAEKAELPIEKLSGGQRKRTSIALELLTRPSLLFLDEPTSGLDPGMDKSLMKTLRDLANDGRTVVVVTHSVAHINVCDRLLFLAPGGRVAFFGPPSEALPYFGKDDYAEVFLELERDTGVDWAGRFRASPVHDQYVGWVQSPLNRAVPPPKPAPRQQPPLVQFSVLCKRALAVMAADRQYILFIAVLPLLLSVLAQAVPGDDAVPGNETRQLLLVLIIGGVLMGSAASVRELVKERAIYQRERAIGLSMPAYLASKLLVIGALAGLESVVFTLLSMIGWGGSDSSVILGSGGAEILVAVVAVTLSSMIIGLAISASIGNADRGMPLLVLVVMLQLILSGGLFPVAGRIGLEQLSWLVPARWGYAMGASTTDLSRVPPVNDDALWRHEASTWLADAMILGAISAAVIAVTALLLRRLDPQRSLGG